MGALTRAVIGLIRLETALQTYSTCFCATTGKGIVILFIVRDVINEIIETCWLVQNSYIDSSPGYCPELNKALLLLE